MHRNLDIRSITKSVLLVKLTVLINRSATQATVNIITNKQTALCHSFVILEESIAVTSISIPNILAQIHTCFTIVFRPSTNPITFVGPFKEFTISAASVIFKFLVLNPKIELKCIIFTFIFRCLELKLFKILDGNLKILFNHFYRCILILIILRLYVFSILAVTTDNKVISLKFVISKTIENIFYSFNVTEVNHKVYGTSGFFCRTCSCGIIEGADGNLNTVIQLNSTRRNNLFSVRIGGCSTASCCLAQFV